MPAIRRLNCPRSSLACFTLSLMSLPRSAMVPCRITAGLLRWRRPKVGRREPTFALQSADRFAMVTSLEVNELKVNRALAGVIVLGAIALAVLFSSFYTVDEGTRGVILRMGAVSGIAQPGIGFKIPLVDRIVPISVQTHSALYPDMEAYSRDQQLATMDVSVTYRILPTRLIRCTRSTAVLKAWSAG